MSGLAPEQRRHILEAVTTWLDALAEAEPPLPGVAPEAGLATAPVPDLLSMLGQLTALTRETQLQGRATNRLHAELSAKLDHLAEHQLRADTLTRKLGDLRREARFEVITELLEVRDRFSRGVEEAQRRLAGLRGFWARFAQREVLAALVEGNVLARERLDDLLRRLDVHEMPCLGQPFDPTLMRAVEVVHTTTAAPGTVVDVFRPGYISNDRVLRCAEVRVVAEARDTPTP